MSSLSPAQSNKSSQRLAQVRASLSSLLALAIAVVCSSTSPSRLPWLLLDVVSDFDFWWASSSSEVKSTPRRGVVPTRWGGTMENYWNSKMRKVKVGLTIYTLPARIQSGLTRSGRVVYPTRFG
ncbi:uncharacterized protein LOC107647940 [Arachis ipaensis]|uniref:uncharacterized protein LOC107647940 n=1 Tax=Arachis ipaensis TaxID=130454 RepID=UPI0007AEF76C|nr:uncharacterized protein LOC107647940 [Arachis ipaensis]XP_025662413.1 uncharacterized protein LOC112758057 [Arachis hypogaea]QHN84636.1 uncharacterized protein DS421_16g530370 [Arachis hypogaea]